MTLREAVQKLVQHEGAYLRRTHWTVDCGVLADTDNGPCLVWARRNTYLVLEVADHLADDYLVDIAGEEATG